MVQNLIDPQNSSKAGQHAHQSRCKCGHGPDHHMVSAHCKYSLWGWFWVTMVGVTTRPIFVSLKCRVCQEVVLESSEPHILDKYT
jgi:hypothetical protein